MLRVDGAFNVPLKSVSAFTRENEYDYIQEGGMNDYVYLRRKPISKPYTLRVERYITTDFNDPLSNGTELLLPLLLFVGKNTGGSMDFGRYYVFTGAVVMSKEYGALDSERSGLLTETVNIGYNQMFCITNPDDSTDKPEWQFAEEDASGEATVNTKRLYSTTPAEPLQNKEKKSSFAGSALKWQFDGKKKEGKGDASRRLYPAEEESKADWFDKRRHFSFGATFNPLAEVDMNSKRSAVNAPQSGTTEGSATELTKEQMAEKAIRFEMDPNGAYTGNGVLMAPNLIENNKRSKSDFIEGKKQWEFDENKKEGKGDHNTQNSLVTDHTSNPDGSSTGLGRPELTKEELSGKSKKFEFTEDGKTVGNGVLMAPKKVEANKKTKKEFIDGERRWSFDEQNKAGTGDSSRDDKGIAEKGKEDLVGNAKKFEFSEDGGVAGNGVLLAPKNIEKNKATKQSFIDGTRRWDFNEYDKEGGGERSRDGKGIEEKAKETLAGEAKKFELTKDGAVGGNGVLLAQKIDANSPDKQTFIDAEKKWEFNEHSKEGKGPSSRDDKGIKEAQKSTMVKKAVRGNYQSIADFLMS